VAAKQDDAVLGGRRGSFEKKPKGELGDGRPEESMPVRSSGYEEPKPVPVKTSEISDPPPPSSTKAKRGWSPPGLR
jgi:hypothetical protein